MADRNELSPTTGSFIHSYHLAYSNPVPVQQLTSCCIQPLNLSFADIILSPRLIRIGDMDSACHRHQQSAILSHEDVF